MNFRTVQLTDQPYLKAAFSKLGLSEIEGAKNEPQVVAMYAACGHPEVHDDETAWCAAFVGWSLAEGGLPNTRSLLAISYAKYGTALDRASILPRGAIAVWHRTGGNHVNFVLHDDGTYVDCIGGNQENGKGGGVTISRRLKADAVAYRMPAGVVVPLPKPKPKPAAPVASEAPDDTSVVSVDATNNKKSDQIETSAKHDVETSGSWLSRKWGTLTGWFSGVGGVGVLGYLTDPWVIVAICGCVLVAFVIFVWFMGPGSVRAWVRKQVS